MAQASAAVGQATGELDALTPEQLLHALCKSVMEKTGEQTTGKSKSANLVAGRHTLLTKLEGEKAMDVDQTPPGSSEHLGSGKGKGQSKAEPTPEEVVALRVKEEQAAEERQRPDALAAARASARKEKEEQEEAAAVEARRAA